MLYQPLPSKGIPKMRFAAADYLEIRDRNHSFLQMGQYFTDEVNLAGREAPERVRGFPSPQACSMFWVSARNWAACSRQTKSSTAKSRGRSQRRAVATEFCGPLQHIRPAS